MKKSTQPSLTKLSQQERYALWEIASECQKNGRVPQEFWEVWHQSKYKKFLKEEGFYIIRLDDVGDDGWRVERTKPGYIRTTEELLDACIPFLDGKPIEMSDQWFWAVWSTGGEQIKNMGFLLRKLDDEMYLKQKRGLIVESAKQENGTITAVENPHYEPKTGFFEKTPRFY